MALDRFVYWVDRRPEDVRKLAEDFFGGGAVHYEDDGSRLYVTLHGAPSNPFERSEPGVGLLNRQQIERWIEVYYADPKYVDVITRMADSYTNALAEGFAALLAHYYGARRE